MRLYKQYGLVYRGNSHAVGTHRTKFKQYVTQQLKGIFTGFMLKQKQFGGFEKFEQLVLRDNGEQWVLSISSFSAATFISSNEIFHRVSPSFVTIS